MIYVLYLLLTVLVTAVGFIAFMMFYRFPGKFFDSNGVPIYYSDEGSGVPVILVHGLGVNADINWRWPGIAKRLRKRGYRVIMLDARGHGKSGKPHEPEKYGREMALDVIRLMDHLGVERAHIAGYSMGGFILLRIVTLHPERFYSAAICASGWSTLNEKNLALIDTIVTAMDRGKLDPVIDWLDINKHASPVLRGIINFVAPLTNDFKAIVNLFRNFPGLVVEEAEMRANTVPTVTIIGDKDGIREYGDQTGTVMARHEIVYLPGGDHWNTPQLPGLYKNLRDHFERNNPGKAGNVAPSSPERMPAAV